MPMQQVAPTVRVFRDDSSGWSIRDLARRQSWRVDVLTAATAIAFMAPQHAAEVAATIAGDEPDGCEVEEVAVRIRKLTELGVLQETDLQSPEQHQLGRWAAKGWGEPFDYLRATWDYPFEDYSRGGQEADRRRMLEYSQDAPDNDRFLELKGSPEVKLPSIQESLDYFNGGRVIDASSLRAHLLFTAAAAAMPVLWKRSRTPGADYMKRTSPSGGCRHPSELYLLSLDIPGLKRGVYHVGVGEGMLGLIGDLDSESVLREKMPGAFRLGAPPRAIFVISTEFARNMYRYREPRTLRTIFYDAGHLGGLIETLCDRLGSVAHGHHGFQDSYVMRAIESPSLAFESPTYLISVGLESEVTPGTEMVGR